MEFAQAWRHVQLVAIGLLVAGLSACADEALLLPLNWSEQDAQVVSTTDLAYGTDARQTLDVYCPQEAQQAPVMVFWYGGSWQQGAKDYYRFVGQSLARHGFVAILPDYRLAPDHPFPAFVEDAASAVRWAHDHAEEFGGDLDRIYISGHSAGGHNALMLALDPRYLDAVGLAPSDLAGVASLAGPTGLENLRGEALKGAFPRAVSDDAFSPVALAARHAETAPPFLLMTGLDDDVIYASSVARLADAIRAGGGSVTIKAYPGIGHIGLMLGLAAPFEGSSRAADDLARFAGL
ncbi:MAG: alpha/beta hydrolase [Rhodospirillales bacterium]|nr:alpha/beta hydrolase [Rhodospirillales bacterium]